jgi:hypothetical protein
LAPFPPCPFIYEGSMSLSADINSIGVDIGSFAAIKDEAFPFSQK